MMLQMAKVPFVSLEPVEHDDPLGLSTGAGLIFGATGGVMEAALRTGYELATGRELPDINLHDVRGLQGLKEAEVNVNGLILKVAVAHGGANIRRVMEAIDTGEREYHFVEFMACTGGCLGGGGEPKSLDPLVLEKRIAAIYGNDADMPLRKSHDNPSVQELYETFLEQPNSHLAHKMLHTHYTDRSHEVLHYTK